MASCESNGATGFGVAGRSGNLMRASTQSAATATSAVVSNRRVSRETRGR